MLEEASGSEDHAHDAMTDDLGINEYGDTEEATSPTDQEEALTIKIAAGVGKTDGPMSILATTVEPDATSPSRPSEGDAASTHSLPIAHVTETQSTQTRPSTARLSSSGSPGLAPPAAARTQRYSTIESTVTAGERPNRYRPNVEVPNKVNLFIIIAHSLQFPVPCIQPPFRFLLESHPSAGGTTFGNFPKWSARRRSIVPSPSTRRLYIRSSFSTIVSNAEQTNNSSTSITSTHTPRAWSFALRRYINPLSITLQHTTFKWSIFGASLPAAMSRPRA
jgi:hypothetical protein